MTSKQSPSQCKLKSTMIDFA